jgi:hypothetical protein
MCLRGALTPAYLQYRATSDVEDYHLKYGNKKGRAMFDHAFVFLRI